MASMDAAAPWAINSLCRDILRNMSTSPSAEGANFCAEVIRRSRSQTLQSGALLVPSQRFASIPPRHAAPRQPTSRCCRVKVDARRNKHTAGLSLRRNANKLRLPDARDLRLHAEAPDHRCDVPAQQGAQRAAAPQPARFIRPATAARPRLIRLDTRMTAHAGCSRCGCGASAASSSPRRIETIGTRRRLSPTARASCA